MAISFKPIEKGQPGVAGGGEKKFYASIVISGETTLEDLTKYIEKISTVSGADIRAVLYAMVDLCIDELEKGNIVRLGDLGSLRPGISSEGHENGEDVLSESIIKTRIIFTPGKRLKQMLKAVGFRKV